MNKKKQSDIGYPDMYRYPIPKYAIFKNYVLFSTGHGIYESGHHSFKIPKKLLLSIVKQLDNPKTINRGV